MNREYCEHGLEDMRRTVTDAAGELLISPNGMAHFPNCPHKGDDPDYSRWATLTTPRAWERLGNGGRSGSTWSSWTLAIIALVTPLGSASSRRDGPSCNRRGRSRSLVRFSVRSSALGLRRPAIRMAVAA